MRKLTFTLNVSYLLPLGYLRELRNPKRKIVFWKGCFFLDLFFFVLIHIVVRTYFDFCALGLNIIYYWLRFKQPWDRHKTYCKKRVCWALFIYWNSVYNRRRNIWTRWYYFPFGTALVSVIRYSDISIKCLTFLLTIYNPIRLVAFHKNV